MPLLPATPRPSGPWHRWLALAGALTLIVAPGHTATLAEQAHAVLEANCFECHSHAARKSRGGLMLDSAAVLNAGGDNGPVVVPRDPDHSALIRAVRHLDPDKAMPKKAAKLRDSDIAVLVQWVKEGTPWPDTASGPAGGEAAGIHRRQPGRITDEDRQWWAFQPVRPVSPPAVRTTNAVRNDVDRFLLARLEAEGLTPAPEAGRAALIRRVTFDLTGLPPTPEEIEAFVTDPDPDAFEQLVDELLARPTYGERMARHWLDLVRYADGDGYRADDYRPHAWRYRDYVIRSFNEDKPFDRFVQEQIAGDELFPDDPGARIATGYLRNGIYEWNARDVRTQWDNMVNDITDTTGDVFLGLGLQCARCHDHKFDPLLQRDYYRLRAVFAAVQPGDIPAVTAREQAAHARELEAWERKTAALREELAKLEQPYLDAAEAEAVGRFPEDIQAMIRKPAGQREPLEAQLAALAWRQVVYDWERVDRRFKGEDKERILALRRQLTALEKDKPAALPVAFAAADVGPQAPPVTIPKKSQAGAIEPGVPTILDPAPLAVTALARSTGRRAAFARWLTTPDNPLTARVMVNRAWQQFFGRGLAANASDFGLLGERPSHPELLDWLARRFVEDGWSLKKLHRQLVTSAAYRRSSDHPSPAAGLLKDPENRWRWRHVPRRLEAEQIRDAMFSVSGELTAVSGGPGRTPDAPVRTIYTRFMRNTRDPLADVFDAPLWFTSASSRDTTTTPVQSLLLANSAPLRARAQAMARRLESRTATDPRTQVAEAYALAFGRRPTDAESAAALAFLTRQASLTDPRKLASGQSAFVPEKVPYRDGQAALIEPEGPQRMFQAEDSAALPVDGAFTLEAFVVPRSVAKTAALRTIAAKWNGNHQAPGWALGITGQQSRRKPLTIALQLVGRNRAGRLAEHPVFSDLNVQMNKPYYVAAAVTPASDREPGQVFFALKDLSNDDEPLLTATVRHEVMGGWSNAVPVTLGAQTGRDASPFHGVIDDVRLSRGALGQGQLLYTTESVGESTLGYWRFEAKPDVFADLSPLHRHPLARPARAEESRPPVTPRQAALMDFCQALLNASEFLYVE